MEWGAGQEGEGLGAATHAPPIWPPSPVCHPLCVLATCTSSMHHQPLMPPSLGPAAPSSLACVSSPRYFAILHPVFHPCRRPLLLCPKQVAKRNNLEEESQHLLHRAMDSFRYERERAAAKRGGRGGSVWGGVWMAEWGDKGGGVSHDGSVGGKRGGKPWKAGVASYFILTKTWGWRSLDEVPAGASSRVDKG